MNLRILAVLLCLCLTPLAEAKRCDLCSRDKHGRIARSHAAKKEFLRQQGWPNGRPGYHVDHTVPLACGGADTPGNMNLMPLEQKRLKDKVERRGC